jgi:long-subunit acyl-CoA synthetase (AMP-forming)
MTFIKSDNQASKIIEDVKISLAADGEILVKVPKEILDHYSKDPAYQHSFTSEGWYCTNVIGKVTPAGVIVKRKKAEQAPDEKENLMVTAMQVAIEGKCHYLSSSLIIGAGGDHPVAILFPDKTFLTKPDYKISPMEGCFCPRDIHELGKCLNGCLNDANCEIGERFARIRTFLIVDTE